MSASIENVLRAGEEISEVTSLEEAVRVSSGLDEELRFQARLMLDRPITVDGVLVAAFTGSAIEMLINHLPRRYEGSETEEAAGIDLPDGGADAKEQ